MTNTKAQMSNECQNPNDKNFGIWVLVPLEGRGNVFQIKRK